MRTKTKNDCRSKGLCHYDSLTRSRFFHGMLLTDEHLRAEQTYHRESLKRLNRHLWGSGIVCGLEVTNPNGLCISVHPGFALDCHGNAIDVDKCITIDLAELCRKQYPDGCAPKDAPVLKKYLVVRYAEVPADPEPVLTPDEDCTPPGSAPKCEASKYREGFCLEFRDECPNCDPCRRDDASSPENDPRGRPGALTAMLSTRQPTSNPEVRKQMDALRRDCMASPPCVDCECCDSAVGLAVLEIDCDGNRVRVGCECRQFVWSPRLLRWLVCQVFNKLDTVPKDSAGLSTHAMKLPTEARIASQPLTAMWEAATEYAVSGDSIRNLLARVEKLESRLPDLERNQPPRRGRDKEKEKDRE
jgi:hypothetical protein